MSKIFKIATKDDRGEPDKTLGLFAAPTEQIARKRASMHLQNADIVNYSGLYSAEEITEEQIIEKEKALTEQLKIETMVYGY